MTNRREFLQGTLAASALPLIGGAAAVPFAANASPLSRVVFDERLPASRAFAARAAQSGIPAHAFKGDVTSLWYNDLHHRWAKKQEAIAGLTEPAALFCLAELARDYGMRLISREDLRTEDGAHLVSWVIAPAKSARLA